MQCSLQASSGCICLSSGSTTGKCVLQMLTFANPYPFFCTCEYSAITATTLSLMKALWRKLAKRGEGKIDAKRYGGSDFGCNASFSSLLSRSQTPRIKEDLSHTSHVVDMEGLVDIFDMFGLLNLSLSTIEYEGSENWSKENGQKSTD